MTVARCNDEFQGFRCQLAADHRGMKHQYADENNFHTWSDAGKERVLREQKNAELSNNAELHRKDRVPHA